MLTKVELPLAALSIRAGVNQTIMLSLAMVVVASLIGAKGLGEDVLEALQYANVGQGHPCWFCYFVLCHDAGPDCPRSQSLGGLST